MYNHFIINICFCAKRTYKYAKLREKQCIAVKTRKLWNKKTFAIEFCNLKVLYLSECLRNNRYNHYKFTKFQNYKSQMLKNRWQNAAHPWLWFYNIKSSIKANAESTKEIHVYFENISDFSPHSWSSTWNPNKNLVCAEIMQKCCKFETQVGLSAIYKWFTGGPGQF